MTHVACGSVEIGGVTNGRRTLPRHSNSKRAATSTRCFWPPTGNRLRIFAATHLIGLSKGRPFAYSTKTLRQQANHGLCLPSRLSFRSAIPLFLLLTGRQCSMLRSSICSLIARFKSHRTGGSCGLQSPTRSRLSSQLTHGIQVCLQRSLHACNLIY